VFPEQANPGHKPGPSSCPRPDALLVDLSGPGRWLNAWGQMHGKRQDLICLHVPNRSCPESSVSQIAAAISFWMSWLSSFGPPGTVQSISRSVCNYANVITYYRRTKDWEPGRQESIAS